VADFLKSKGKMSNREANELFMKGIHIDIRYRVLNPLQIVKSNQPSGKPYPRTEVIKAMEWAIDGVPRGIYKELDKDGVIVKKEIVNMSTSLLDIETAIKRAETTSILWSLGSIPSSFRSVIIRTASTTEHRGRLTRTK
jgi:hypothetical protein